MKKYIFGFISLAALALAACDDDDVLVGSNEADQWMHPYGASEADQALQSKFYKDNGIYLLFNDTLRKEQVAVNPDGTPFYDMELVDLNYYLTGSSGSYNTQIFEYEYLTTDTEKKNATDFVQNKVLPHLSGDLLPFSILLVNRIDYWSGSRPYIMLENPAVYSGYRCSAISVGGISDMDDAQLTAHCNQILMAIINSKTSSLPEETFDEFYSYTNDYYYSGPKWMLMGDAAAEFFASNPVPMCIGLLDNKASYWQWNPTAANPMYTIAYKANDLQDFTSALFSYTETEFTAKYGEYPIVMAKYKILKQIYEGIGVKF